MKEEIQQLNKTGLAIIYSSQYNIQYVQYQNNKEQILFVTVYVTVSAKTQHVRTLKKNSFYFFYSSQRMEFQSFSLLW